jgi:hypothetical protein
MSTWIGNAQRRDTNGQGIHEKVFKFPGYKRDVNQNDTTILSHPS